jgi:membrane peptidoglycan carboxypeptidase
VTPLELTAAYATFANGGQSVLPYVIRGGETTNGTRALCQRQPMNNGQVVEPQPLSMMNAMMNQTTVSGNGAHGAQHAGVDRRRQDRHQRRNSATPGSWAIRRGS